ncbi:MAG: Mur ligase family protein [bacterium]
MKTRNSQIPAEAKKIYLMAICGTGMGSLAGMLKEKGFDVSGSDNNVYPPMSDELREQGIAILTPFSVENIKNIKPDLVIVGNAITKNNPEAQYILEEDIPYVTMPEALQYFFFKEKEVIAVTGTHGKTTTTAIMAHLLTEMGADPSFLVGGVAKNQKRNFRLGQGKYFIIEGDEYDTAFFEKTPKFLHYNPKHVIATSLEFDHADIYNNVEEIEEAFSQLFDKIPTNGSLHFSATYPCLEKVAKSKMGQIAYFMRRYGTDVPVWQITHFQATKIGSIFDISVNEKTIVHVESPLAGLYNAENVAACFSVLERLGFSLIEAVNALKSFEGVKRRQEILYEDEQWIVIDDFAHHPTAVKETIQAIKDKYPNYQLISVFEPRSNTTRRNLFQADYAKSFLHSDVSLIAPVDQPEKVVDGEVLDIKQIVDFLKQKEQKAFAPNSLNAIPQLILDHSKQPTVVLFMSNGGFGGIQNRFIDKIAQHDKGQLNS